MNTPLHLRRTEIVSSILDSTVTDAPLVAALVDRALKVSTDGPDPVSNGVEYSYELAAQICARLADGETLKRICDSEGMANRRTVHRWLADRPAFLVMYRAARDEHADAEFDRMDEVLKEPPRIDDKGRVDTGWVQQQRLRLDTMKWKLARISPKKYSERFEVVGAGGEPLIPEMTVENQIEGARRLAFVLARAGSLIAKAVPTTPLQLTQQLRVDPSSS